MVARLSAWAAVQLVIAAAALTVGIVLQRSFDDDVDHVHETGTKALAVVTEAHYRRGGSTFDLRIPVDGRIVEESVFQSSVTTQLRGGRQVLGVRYDPEHTDRIVTDGRDGKPVVIGGFEKRGLTSTVLEWGSLPLGLSGLVAAWDLWRTRRTDRKTPVWRDAVVEEVADRGRRPALPALHRLFRHRRLIVVRLVDGDARVPAVFLLSGDTAKAVKAGDRIRIKQRVTAVALEKGDGSLLAPAGWLRLSAG